MQLQDLKQILSIPKPLEMLRTDPKGTRDAPSDCWASPSRVPYSRYRYVEKTLAEFHPQPFHLPF